MITHEESSTCGGYDNATMQIVADAMKEANFQTEFTMGDVLGALTYWRNLSANDLVFFWKHYTVGKGAGMYVAVKPETSFLDYLVLSAQQSSFERAYDL